MTTLQGARLKATTASIMLAMCASWPTATAHLHYLQITAPLAVSAEKSHPPHIAFMEADRSHLDDEWDLQAKKPAVQLSTQPVLQAEVSAELIHLAAMVIEQPRQQVADISSRNEVNEELDLSDLNPSQRLRLQEAQSRYRVLEQNWAVADNQPEPETQVAQQSLIGTPVARAAQRPAFAPTSRSAVLNPPAAPATEISSPKPTSPIVRSFASQARGFSAAPTEDVNISAMALAIAASPAAGEVELTGNVSIQGGLTFGPGRSLEVAHRLEGVEVAQGQVDLKTGTYTIRVSARAGQIVARLREGTGRILSEASYHLSQIQGSKSGTVAGPTLNLVPRSDVAGNVVPLYEGMPTAGVQVTAFSKTANAPVAKSGEFELNQIQQGSYTVMHAQARHYLTTVSMVPAGSRSDLRLFPESWALSLKRIVSDQKKMSLDDPDSSIVWGRLVQDGKPRAGLTVEMESSPGVETVYFNQFLLPDPNLKATSENGLFAMVGAPEGFQSLLAKSGDIYYAHENIVVEPGAVSVAELANTLRTETTPVRVYDAFTGASQPISLSHQAVDGEVTVNETGMASLILPVVHRLSLVQVRPESPYVPATYFSSDDDGFLHIPLVREDWIRALQAFTKIDDTPDGSVVVGFVPDEAFTVDVVDPENHVHIIYFDSEGNPSATEVGPKGGGFLIVGLTQGVREVIVTGEESKQLSSRVIPADPRAVSVLTFRAE